MLLGFETKLHVIDVFKGGELLAILSFGETMFPFWFMCLV